MYTQSDFVSRAISGGLVPDSPIQNWDIGIDLVDIERFERIDYGNYKPFYERIFTPREIEYCLTFAHPAPHFASSFAGKEAVYKAVRNFCAVNIWKIEVLRDEEHAPRVNFLGPKVSVHSTLRVKLSLSHSLRYAVAIAVASA